MKRYFKIIHASGPPGLCILSGPEGKIAQALESLVCCEGERVIEIEQKDARKVRAEISRYEQRQYEASQREALKV